MEMFGGLTDDSCGTCFRAYTSLLYKDTCYVMAVMTFSRAISNVNMDFTSNV